MSDNTEYASPIPRAVREQAERADQLARELGATNVPEASDGALVPQEDGGDRLQQATPQEEGGGGASSPPPEPQNNDSSSVYEQRWRTLQGKYEAETGGLRAQVQTLQNLLSNLSAAPPPAPPPPLAPPTPVVTAEDREMWGDDLPNAVGRWVGQAQEGRFRQLEHQNAQLRQEVMQLRGGQERVDTTLIQHSVQAQLDMDPALAGRWRQLNEDENYHQWLSEVDPFSGQQRLLLLREAYAQGDAGRTGRFFKTYLAEHTAPSARYAQPHTGQNGSVPAGQMRLEQLAAPGRAAASGTNGGASPEKRMWTNREIGAFYRDVQRGVYRGRDADKLRTEQDIIAAASEGRVTQ